MKHVPRPANEPPMLAEYRKQPGSEVGEGSDIWNRFRDFESSRAYKELRELLLNAQGGLCGYCERYIRNSNDICVEHVIPKGDEPNRTLDWLNLMVCCLGGTAPKPKTIDDNSKKSRRGKNKCYCDKKKLKQKLPPGCDPRDFPVDESLFQIDFEGYIHVDKIAAKEYKIEHSLLEKAINNILNLNHLSLRLDRRNIYAELQERNEVHVVDLEMCDDLSDRIDLTRSFVRDELEPDSQGDLMEYWSLRRQLMEEWILYLE